MDTVQGIIHMHGNNIVHGSIRPHNILVKMYKEMQIVPKLRGISRCKICADEQGFTRDLYGIGRTILTCETKGKHIIQDDNDIDELCYRKEDLFKDDMDELRTINLFAHDLVTRLLAYKEHRMSAKEVINHYYFWEDRTYLDILQCVSNAIEGNDGDKALLNELIKYVCDVFYSNWTIDEPWYTKTNAYDYKDTKIEDLLRLINNGAYQLKREYRTKFEKYIFKGFPRLFCTVFHVVKKSKNPFFNDYLTGLL